MANDELLDGLAPTELFSTPETDVVFVFPVSDRFPRGIWVEFRRTLPWGDRLAIQNALFKGMGVEEVTSANAGGSSSTVYTDMGRQKLYRLAYRIKDWNFPGPDGKTVRWPDRFGDRLGVLRELNDKLGDWLDSKAQEYEVFDESARQSDPDDDESARKDPLALQPVGD